MPKTQIKNGQRPCTDTAHKKVDKTLAHSQKNAHRGVTQCPSEGPCTPAGMDRHTSGSGAGDMESPELSARPVGEGIGKTTS